LKDSIGNNSYSSKQNNKATSNKRLEYRPTRPPSSANIPISCGTLMKCAIMRGLSQIILLNFGDLILARSKLVWKTIPEVPFCSN
jgi:hypothetical protein